LELHRQAASLQETVEVRFADESDTELLLIFRTEDMKVKYVPERNAVRWETEKDYGFERLSDPTALLVAPLIKWLQR
jgi:hypothetical protein